MGVGCRPRELQEDFVQRGMADGDVLDVDARVVEGAHHAGEHARSPGSVDRASFGVGVDRGCPDAHALEHVGRTAQGGGLARVQVEHVRADTLLEIGGRSLGHDPPAVDDHDERRQMVGLVQVLRGQQDVGPGVAQRHDGVPQLDAAPRVEAGGRLVEEQQPWRAHQAGPEVEAPSHPSRVRLHETVAGVGQAELLQRGRRRGSGRATGPPVEPGHHGQVLRAGHHLLHRGRLAGQTDHATHGLGLPHDVVARDGQRSGIGSRQGGHGADERGFARAVGPENGDDASGRDVEVQLGQGRHAAEPLDEAAGLDERSHGVFLSPWSRGRSRSVPYAVGAAPSEVPSESTSWFHRPRGRVHRHAAPSRSEAGVTRRLGRPPPPMVSAGPRSRPRRRRRSPSDQPRTNATGRCRRASRRRSPLSAP